MAESSTPPVAPPPRTRLLRGNPALRSLCASRAVSFVGDGITATVLVVLAARQDGPVGVSLLLLANALPRLAGPLAGVLADRVPTRRLMMRCELASGLVIGLIAVTLPPLPVLVPLAGALAPDPRVDSGGREHPRTRVRCGENHPSPAGTGPRSGRGR
nr:MULTISPECIES: MFS transporter [Streptomyces]